MKSAIATIGITLSLLLTSAVPTSAYEGSSMKQWRRYPGTMCFNPSGGMLPNASTGIGNWSGVPQLASCPIITDDRIYGRNEIFFAQVRATAGTSCILRVNIQSSDWGWVYYPAYVSEGIHVFGQTGAINSEDSAAFECIVANNNMIYSYSAHTTATYSWL